MSKSSEKFPSKEIQFNFLLTQCFPLVYPGNHFKNNYNDVIASIILPNTLHILANTIVHQMQPVEGAWATVLVHLGHCNRNIIDWTTWTTNIYFSQKSKIKMPEDSLLGGGICPGSKIAIFSL